MTDSSEADVASIGRIAAVPAILDVICRSTGMGFAAIARVTEARWVACSVLDNIAFGLRPGEELKLETTICRDIRDLRAPVVIDHVAQDEIYAHHPTPQLYGFQSYISVPIILSDGTFFGTLCAIDPKPARLKNPETMGTFKLFAELIAFHIDANARLAVTAATLADVNKTSELREQFIAVLGHDLRNPLASLQAGVRLLSKTPLTEKATSYLTMMQASVTRMSGLIDNVLDFARGRLSGGFTLDRHADVALTPVLNEVIDEIRVVSPEKQIITQIALPVGINCDRIRIGQLVSNLVANALTHGAADRPIKISASIVEGQLDIAVSNGGKQISEATKARLFQPFSRGEIKSGEQGLGLGLFIACEIAKAHGGTLTVGSTDEETRFTFRMPLI